LRRLYLLAETLGLKDHEWQSVPLVHSCLRGTSQWAMLPEVLLLCLYAVLHPGSLVSCHNFLVFFLYLKRRSRPGISLFESDKVILFVDSLYADAIEGVKARAALSVSTLELISTLGDIGFEARL
jgi:hypothetical protein